MQCRVEGWVMKSRYFIQVPSGAVRDPRSGSFWVPATPQTWLPLLKSERRPIHPGLSPHPHPPTSPSHPLLTSAMPREQYTVNSRRQGAFVSGFLCRVPHVSRSQHLHIIRYNQAKMRFHAKKKEKPSLGRNILSFMTSQNINADHYTQCIQRVARY